MIVQLSSGPTRFAAEAAVHLPVPAQALPPGMRDFCAMASSSHRQLQEADEVRDEYADTIGKIHLTYYKTYLSKLLKFQVKKRARIIIVMIIFNPCSLKRLLTRTTSLAPTTRQRKASCQTSHKRRSSRIGKRFQLPRP